MAEPRTLCEVFQKSVSEMPRPAAFLHKVQGAYRAVSSQEAADRVAAMASGLRLLGVQPGDRVAILSENRIEWALADWAILGCGAVSVPVYPTLPAATVQNQLRDCEAMAVFVSTLAQLAKLGGPSVLPHLRHAVLFEGEPAAAPGATFSAHTLRDLDARGLAAHDPDAAERLWRAVGAQDLASIIYTSGTSGGSKGVMLTHANILANIRGMLQRVPLTARDVALSFLPLSHVFERTCGHFALWHVGATIAYAESVESVPQNLLEVRPTMLISVPRLYEKMNARILAAVGQAPALRQRLFRFAMRAGRARVRRQQAGRGVPPWLAVECAVADRLVFAKLRQRLGGRMRTLVSGGAPLSPAIAEFFYAAGLPILEGYGLTETAPVVSVNPPARPRIGTVGPPLANVEVRIGPQDEILVRGPSIMQGYFRNPQATAEALRDGWFHTGDVGRLDADGYLCITDRLKDILVTAGGKNVAPQPIEARLKASQYVLEVVLVGDRRKYLSAIVVPNFANLETYARAQGARFASHTDLACAPAVLRLFEGVFGEVNATLAPFERIRRFRLLDRELELQTGELTPSMKVKRNVVAATFADCVASMYQDPPPAGVGCPPAGEPAAAPEPQQSPAAS